MLFVSMKEDGLSTVVGGGGAQLVDGNREVAHDGPLGTATTEPERLYAGMCRAANMRAWGTLGDCFAEHVEMPDRLALGWDVVRGRTSMVETFQSWAAVSADIEYRVEPLASDD